MGNISVAMTTYNGEAYLLPQLQSLLNQTRQADEVVICDDRSEDATVSLIRSFIEEHGLSHWRLIENRRNLGYIHNFRKAMMETTGDLVFLCDQDDIWAEDKIRILQQQMEENPQIDALVSGYSLIDGAGKPLQSDEKHFYTPEPGANLLSPVKSGRVLYRNMAQGCTGVYRRSLLERYVGCDNTTALAHDWALHFLAYERNALYFWNQELVLYRIHSKNTTGIDRTSRENVLRKDMYALEDCLLLPIKEESKLELQRILAFYRIRIQWLTTHSLSVWIRGWRCCLKLKFGIFVMQYIKDFLWVFLGCKSSAED